jgi:hypothetical protein
VERRRERPRVLTKRFWRTAPIYAPAGSPERKAVRRVVAELCDEGAPLPGPDDVATVIPPALRCMARRIPSAGIEVCYSLEDGVVWIYAVRLY